MKTSPSQEPPWEGIDQLDCGSTIKSWGRHHARTIRSWSSFKKDQKGLMSPGTRGADAQGPGWVDDPQAVGVEEEGTHDVGQVGRKSQRWKT